MGAGASPKALLLSFFALILLSNPVHAATGNWYDSLYVWLAVAVAISSTVIGLAYMVAKLFELQVLEAWSKIELSELMTSIVIAVFCVGLIASVNSAAQFLTGQHGTGQQGDVSAIAQNFLNNSVYADGKTIYSALGEAYFRVAKISSFSYTAGLSISVASASYSESPAGGLFALGTEISQGMDSVANFMLLAASQAAFLIFFSNAATIMLPVGIFLRSFSFTRKIGAVVLAGVIASSVIYPASFLISQDVYKTFRSEMMNDANQLVANLPALRNPPSTELICNPWQQAIVQSPVPLVGGEIGWYLITCPVACAASAIGGGFGACMESCKQIVALIFTILKAVMPIIDYGASIAPYRFGTITIGNLMTNYFEPVYAYALPTVTKYAILSIVTFLIPLIFTMSMLRSLAVAFGGEPQLYGLSKLV
ncbi:MAG: hypothetical protein NT051_02325 [Candidatus Micrarchaeota archaeon]|nr:hypothetical protein [Candidatus Micrarchaeota archaeon]